MIRFLADENLNNQIVRGILRQNPDLVESLKRHGVSDEVLQEALREVTDN